MGFVAGLVILAGVYTVYAGATYHQPVELVKELAAHPERFRELLTTPGTWGRRTAGPTAGGGGKAIGVQPGAGSVVKVARERNGRLSDAELQALATAKGHRLQPAAAAAFDAMSTAYRARFGRYIAVTDSYRTYARQVALKATKGRMAAEPGTSNHGAGTAVDLGGGINRYGTPQYQWMVENAGRYGFRQPTQMQKGGSLEEPWHWEYQGG